MTVGILIADDHGVVRAGLRMLLNAEPDLQVVGEAADGDAALQMAVRLQPDVVLADISMPGPSGIDVARQLRAALPSTHVLVLTMHEDQSLMEEALRAGAFGYLSKRSIEADLIRAVRVVASGGQYIQEGLLPASTATMARSETAPVSLDEGEMDLLRLLASGKTDAEIAGALATDVVSIQQRRARLNERLGFRGRVDLMRYAREHGI